jgi:DNA-binding response OmpR family regulator
MNPYNILIVDNEVNNLYALNRTFRNEYNVFLSTNAENALAIMEQENIALVLAENRMTGMNGTEFLRKASRKYPDAVCVIFAAYTNEKTIVDAINMQHIYSCIIKPWDPEEARAIVRAGIEAYEATRSNKARNNSRKRQDDDSETRKARNKMLGQILMDQNIVSENQLTAALGLQKREKEYEGKKLGEILIDLGYADEEGILSCYALQLGMPYILLSEFRIKPELTKLMPLKLAQKYATVPVDILGRVLSIAVSEPLDNGAKGEIEKKTGYKIMPVCASHQDINVVLEQHYANQA